MFTKHYCRDNRESLVQPYPRSNLSKKSREAVRIVSITYELKSWSWIFKIWACLYPVLVVLGILMGTLLSPSYYWIATIIGVPLAVIPVTYRNLVGGGCSLRFQICALVKGMLAGSILLILALVADSIVWQVIGSSVGWSPMTFDMFQEIYLIWLFSGTIGGFGARIVEVRSQTRPTEIRIVGFE
jgi:hypothetical protein